MVLMEISVVPLGVGDSIAPYVAKCVDLIDRSGLDYELHATGTIVEGELSEVLDLIRQCMDETTRVANRVICSIRLDYDSNKRGQLHDNVARVERELGRPVNKSS